jgi:hypothetical protein|tara:strand:+ start:2831 stop:3982 length:1152 start_codon:yes stop_codon:yes gene_type:complete
MDKVASAVEDKTFLWGPQGSFDPEVIPAPDRDVGALQLFQSFLCNNEDEAAGLSNVLTLWELIPKYTADQLNYLDVLPNDYQTDFTIYNNKFKLTVFPGTYYPKGPKNKSDVEAAPKRRFPGFREQVVEQALIHLATQQARAELVNNKVSYYVTFSIRELYSVLRSMGRSQSHYQIREALEVLTSSIITIKSSGGTETTSRYPIVPSFSNTSSADELVKGRDVWKIALHPLVINAIQNSTYRQYPLAPSVPLAGFAAYLLRQMFFSAPNISGAHPLKVSLLDLSSRTPGLEMKTMRASINAMIRELDKMRDGGLLEEYEVIEILPKRKGRGRPAPVDAEFVLYPGTSWIRDVKAGSKRLALTEKALGLARSQRDSRQKSLPFL